ncbi:MAG TPA: N-acetylornithine carbamoyltransferase, partial [Steroidobacteraceae bacterium]|nr:N-acetylornithine carbamoyltransferase [Steroidobacteraceae bacterium]
FFNPSLRSMTSMRVAMARLGGESVTVTPGAGSWQLETRSGVTMTGPAAEHIREAIPVLDSYCDALGVRAFAEGRDLDADLSERTFASIASLCRNPLINLESSANHPCQALADWKTLDDLGVARRARFVLAWANHPRALPLAVPAAVSHMAALRGMEVVVLRPEGYGLPPQLMEKAQRAAEASGGSIAETDDRDAALAGAQVVYAKEWGSTTHYGDAEADARARAGLADWMVRESWFARAAKDCHLMHCLPVRRNVAVADQALDGPRSRVLQQAHNRLVVQMAVLYRLLGGSGRRH